MMEPPADSMSALNQTVSDSARLPWALRILPWSRAASISCSQVTGCSMSSPAASATDFRYQSSCVLAQNGTATSSSFQVDRLDRALDDASLTSLGDVVGHRAPGSRPARTPGRTATSRLMMSIERSAGREAAHQLLALGVGVAGQHRDLDRVRPVRLLAAATGDLRLPAAVRVDVPGQRGRARRSRRHRRRPGCRQRRGAAAAPASPRRRTCRPPGGGADQRSATRRLTARSVRHRSSPPLASAGAR